MRMRRKPWAKEFLEGFSQVSFSGEKNKGQWLKGSSYQQLIVEIDCGKGDYLFNMSQLESSALWVGIEKDENVSAIALKKVKDQIPSNTHWIVGDAENLENWFDTKEVNRVHLNFSDPWPKKRNTKRRLTSDKFVERLLNILSDDGEIRFKTDNVALFEYTVLLWENYPLEMVEFSVDYRRNEHPEDVITEYEKRFMDLGQPIFRSVWRKKNVK